MLVKFKKPVVFEGKEYESINIDLDSQTAENYEATVDQIVASFPKGKNLALEIERKLWLFITARASGLPPEFFMNLPLVPYAQIKGQVLSFLQESAVEFSFPSES